LGVGHDSDSLLRVLLAADETRLEFEEARNQAVSGNQINSRFCPFCSLYYQRHPNPQMSQNRKPRGIYATENGHLKLQEAKAADRDEDGQPLTFERIALKAGVNERTVRRLFNKDGVDRDSGFAICKALGLEPTKILELNPPSEEPDRIGQKNISDELAEIRLHCCDKVQRNYSQIELFNRKQIGVDQLYVDVYVLEDLESVCKCWLSSFGFPSSSIFCQPSEH
jgi:AraC-like DNA-binding protein